MKKFDDELEHGKYKEGIDWRILIPVLVVVILLVITICAMLFMKRGTKDSEEKESASAGTELVETMGAADAELSAEEAAEAGYDVEDPQQDTDGSMSSETGASVDVKELLTAGDVAETEGTTFGIDVAKYQGTIDWAKVAEAGVDFAMIRVGYRTMTDGEISPDSNARYNMQEAQANGIKVGVYFFSTAVTKEEAEAEADWVADYISQYQITYPVAYNCEGFENPDSRQYGLSQTERSDIAMVFMERIYEHGYTPMFYAAKSELADDAKWDTSRIEQNYKIWISQYPAAPYPETEQADYTGVHGMWQYTNQGMIPGIDRQVDLDIAYFGYEGVADAKNDETPETATADVEALMDFTEVNETVTAKEKTNLRDIPSQDSESQVMYTLSNGETATRTGVSNSGWSRVILNGETYYAVSNYLTTDLNYQPPAADGSGSGDGLKTKFTQVEDQVTAKIEVNLRTLPSVTNPDAAVVAVLHNGEVVTRTGINEDYGWSRVDYNGQTLYCVSSYLTSAQ